MSASAEGCNRVAVLVGLKVQSVITIMHFKTPVVMPAQHLQAALPVSAGMCHDCSGAIPILCTETRSAIAAFEHDQD